MSNYDWRELPPELAEYAGHISAGADEINGTGRCQVRFRQDGDMVFFAMPGSQVRALAAYLAQVADDADRHYHQEQCGCNEAGCKFRHVP